MGGFAGVFEVDSKVRAFSLAALGGIFRLNGIASHYPNSSEKKEIGLKSCLIWINFVSGSGVQKGGNKKIQYKLTASIAKFS